ncbi:sensor histidine kinase [Paenibacillus baekrokdamisoli]|uniref:sensor histidine kinase n=1 Tax=Paenibacillus baekrokdamisoli TaxID=1712516 RepID=UPI001C857765|nr:sensor histidine kinase [Paenibacillus baekrokdamisoli]
MPGLLLILLLLPLLLSSCSVQTEASKPTAVHGELDLRKWSFESNGELTLSGQWAFFGKQLLQPNEAHMSESSFVMVPRSWNSYPASFGFKNGQGYATYRLTVRIQPTEHVLALRVPNIFSSYKLWVNGDLLAAEGVVGTSRDTSSPEQFPRIVSFDAHTDKLDIVVQVSNFQHRKGGIWVDFKLGDSDQIVRSQMIATAQEMAILGSLIIIGVYHIGLYAFWRQEQFTIHFGLLCLFVAARSSVTGDSYLMQLFPISWETGLKIEYISLVFSAVTGFLYVYRLFPGVVSKRVVQAIIGIGMMLCLFVLVFPAIVYSKSLPIFQLFVLGVGMYCLIIVIKALILKRAGAGFVLAGVAVFVLTVMNDMLFYNEWFVFPQLVPIGLFFFMLMQSFIISTRFSTALRRVGQVSDELRELNTHLEERIEERTEALSLTNETLEQRNRDLGRMETSRRHLMTNISHDLRTPITLLQGYLEAIQDGVVKSEEQRQKYVRMMLGKVGGLNRLIHDLFELSKLEAGQLRFDLSDVLLSEWIEQIQGQYEIDIRSGGLSFTCAYDYARQEVPELEQPERILVKLDLPRMDQVIANVIYNALKHTPRNGHLSLLFYYDYETSRVIINVCDTGSGIETEHLPFIFDRFYKKEISRNSAEGGSGLGLAIAKEIVEGHEGTIGAESIPNKGTTIWISLPARKM